MIKYCPIMSYRDNNMEGIYCMDDSCEWWDEEKRQCCIKTQALAAAAKPPAEPEQLNGTYPPYQQYFTTTPCVVPTPSGDWTPNPYRVDN